jgi:subtilisin-like proprotein convertase family protein
VKIIRFAICLIGLLGLAGTAQASLIEESCTDCPLDIPPSGSSGTTDSFLNVGDSGIISDVDIFVNLTHTFTGDLDIFIIHDSVTVHLFDSRGGAGNNITDVTFDDEAIATIGVTAPFGPGSFQPTPGALTAFDGLDVNGQWQLQIVDNFGGDTGMLLDWRVIAEVQMGPQQVVPEPTITALLLAGIAGLGFSRRRNKTA